VTIFWDPSCDRNLLQAWEAREPPAHEARGHLEAFTLVEERMEALKRLLEGASGTTADRGKASSGARGFLRNQTKVL
jgi:hypothetical protein